MKAKVKDIIVRACKTALQAFLAALPITATTFTADKALLKTAIISALAAGLSAGMNVIITALEKDYL